MAQDKIKVGLLNLDTLKVQVSLSVDVAYCILHADVNLFAFAQPSCLFGVVSYGLTQKSLCGP